LTARVESGARPSLRARLLRDIMLPLALMWAAGAAVAVGVASFFTQQAYDRSLLDDAYLMATNVREGPAGLELALSPRELGTLLYDHQQETVYHALRVDGRLVEGQAVQAPVPQDDEAYRFSDIAHDGRNLRAVTLRREMPRPFVVTVALTTQNRGALLQRLLAYSVAPQAVLLVLLAWWLHRAITRDMRPLAALEQALERRDAHDLRAVPADASTRDVQRLGDAINSLLGRLQLSVQAQREFAGNVAHELRTPLAGIRALASYGLAQKDPAALREQLERIARSEARASHMVDQLLALALADEAHTGIQLQTVALDALVRDAALRFLQRADAQGVDLGALGAEDPVTVRADPTLLEGLLDNLIDNALRYGKPADGTPASVTVAIERRAGRVLLSVVDNGPGLPEGAAPQLLRRWSQGEIGQALRQGSGLGLAIVSRYAQLMEGQLALAPGPDGRGLSATLAFAEPAA